MAKKKRKQKPQFVSDEMEKEIKANLRKHGYEWTGMPFSEARLFETALLMMDRHKLRASAGSRWKFTLNTRKLKILGRCSPSHRIIEIIEWYVISAPDWLVMDTILHEIAHALTPRSAHGKPWKQMCLAIGACPNRLKALAATAPVPERRYVAVCSGCERRHQRVRKLSSRSTQYFCRCNTIPLTYVENSKFREPKEERREKKAANRMKSQVEKRGALAVGTDIHSVIEQLTNATDSGDKRRLRAKLRKLGHTGGLKGA